MLYINAFSAGTREVCAAYLFTQSKTASFLSRLNLATIAHPRKPVLILSQHRQSHPHKHSPLLADEARPFRFFKNIHSSPVVKMSNAYLVPIFPSPNSRTAEEGVPYNSLDFWSTVKVLGEGMFSCSLLPSPFLRLPRRLACSEF